MRDEGDCDQIFALAVRLMGGEQVQFVDAFGNEFRATESSIIPHPYGAAVSEGDAFEVAKHIRALVAFRPARAASAPARARGPDAARRAGARGELQRRV